MYPELEPKRPVKRRFKLIVIGLVLILVSLLWQASRQGLAIPAPLAKLATEEQPGLYNVVSVSDGDTIEVSQAGVTETVRFIGIDTPEVKDPRKAVQCFGHEASERTKSLLNGQKVRLEPDTVGDNRDKYHRLLRYVYLPDGTMVNELLVQDGYAFAYIIFPFDKLDQFQADQEQARAQNRGLWGGCDINESTEIKQTNSVN